MTERVLEFIYTINSLIEAGIKSFNIRPDSYQFIFPTSVHVDRNKINDMVNDGVFPTLEGLAPAFTVFIILSVGRMIFQHILLKVSHNVEFTYIFNILIIAIGITCYDFETNTSPKRCCH